eukprot:XP_002262065.1 [Plasmodium knowlesi strain H]
MTKGTPAGQQAKNAKNKPILLNKKLLIIKSNEDIKKLIKKENPTEEEVNELKAVLESSEKKTEKKKKKNIVIPRFKICEDDETYTSKLKTFEKPAHYIRYELYKDQVTGIKLTDGSIIHYDLLKEDELFLQSLNSSINIQLNDEDFCKLIDKFEKITGYSENKEEINLKDAIKATADLKINLKSNVVKDIHTYWKSKRKKLGRPLLRMFWNSSQNILPHYSVFRSRVKEKMTLRKHKKKNSEIILKMQELIEDFRRLDRILRKMKQRDEKKLLLLHRKINKRAKSQGLCEQMNATKINRNEYQNVVLVKRRGRSNRIWVDRKFVSEMNNEDINCCDLSYTFNDFVEASLNLKKNYEEDLSNYISGKQKHIPIKLGIKSGDIKNLDSNFFSNQKNGEQQPGDGGAAEMDIAGIGTTAIGTSPLGNPDDGGVLFEKYEEMKKEKKRRKRKKESKDVAPNTSYDPINASPAQPQPVEDELTASHRYANGITGVPVEGNHNYFDYPSNYNNQKEDKRFFSSICSKGEAELIGNSSLWGKYNTNTNEAWNGKTKPFEDESPYPLMNLSNDKMENTLNEYKFTANGDANNKNANTNSVHSSEEASYNRALFQFEDLVNPQLNRDNYIFCLSKYACVQKRILFYLENMLNFDNYNFKSKKRESSTNVPRGASSGAAPVQLPHEGQNMDKGEQVQEVGNLVEPNHRPQEGIETIAPDTSDLLHIDTHN